MLISFNLIAKSHIVSTIPIPKAKILKTSCEKCDTECLNNLLIDGKIFSFLAYIDDSVTEVILREKKLMYYELFNINNKENIFGVRIAVLLPSKIIGSYAKSTTNAVFSYLMAKNKIFEMKTFNIQNETLESITQGLIDIQKEDFLYVIAPMTPKGANLIADLSPSIYVFIPTVHSIDVPKRNKNMFFGGINYTEQIEKLLQIHENKMVLIHDNGSKGTQLNDMVKLILAEKYPNTKIAMENSVSRKASQFDYLFKKNKRIKHSSVFLNTPIVKTSLIMSSMTQNETNPSKILSTQINYNSNILNLTQKHDRTNLFIANSIFQENKPLIEANKLLNNDIKYDWINYSTTLGVDYFFHIATGIPQDYNTKIENNQIIYPVDLYKATSSRFQKVEE
jgi:hypothetical protein